MTRFAYEPHDSEVAGAWQLTIREVLVLISEVVTCDIPTRTLACEMRPTLYVLIFKFNPNQPRVPVADTKRVGRINISFSQFLSLLDFSETCKMSDINATRLPLESRFALIPSLVPTSITPSLLARGKPNIHPMMCIVLMCYVLAFVEYPLH